MMPGDTGNPTTRRPARYREIIGVLSRHGLGYLVARVHPRDATPTPPEHVRLALAELGPTFVKLGQFLSTRSDLLPPEYLAELAKLQDAAPPVDSAVVRSLVADELDTDLSEVFARFDETPLAAASIGQAHAATLPDGTEVVVKVRRPGVVEQVEQDLGIVQDLAARAARHSDGAAEHDVVGLAADFARTLRSELDYLTEGRNADRFAENFADDADIHIPRVYWEATTSRLLTMERMRGIKINDLAGLDAAGIDRHALADRATRLTAQMIFDDGLFHADPHPGNLFIEADGRIGVIDFGMVGTIDARLRDQLGAVLVAFTAGDADDLTDAFLAFGIAAHGIDRPALRTDVADFLRRHQGLGLADLSINEVAQEIVRIMRDHRLHLPRDLALLLKVLVMDERLAAELDPGYRLDEALAPFARALVERQRAPDVLLQRLADAGVAAAKLGVEVPEQARRLLRALEAGDLRVRTTSDQAEAVGMRAERVGNRIAGAVLVAALIDAAVTLLAARGRPRRRPRWTPRS